MSINFKYPVKVIIDPASLPATYSVPIWDDRDFVVHEIGSGLTVDSIVGLQVNVGTQSGLVINGGIVSAQVGATLKINTDPNLTNVGDIDTIIPVVDSSSPTYNINTTDYGALIRIDSMSAVDVEIPTNASVPFPVGTMFMVEQAGSATITIIGASGVSVLGLNGGFNTAGQYAMVKVIQVQPDVWTVYFGV